MLMSVRHAVRVFNDYAATINRQEGDVRQKACAVKALVLAWSDQWGAWNKTPWCGGWAKLQILERLCNPSVTSATLTRVTLSAEATGWPES